MKGDKKKKERKKIRMKNGMRNFQASRLISCGPHVSTIKVSQDAVRGVELLGARQQTVSTPGCSAPMSGSKGAQSGVNNDGLGGPHSVMGLSGHFSFSFPFLFNSAKGG